MRFGRAKINLFCEPTNQRQRQHGGAIVANPGQPAQPAQTAVKTEDDVVLTDENGNAIIIE